MMTTIKKFLLTMATAISIAAVTTTTLAAPLPDGTLLTIAPTTDLPPAGGITPCTTGSCWGFILAPGLFYWTPLHSGTDGGIIIGKGQKSGGQEYDALSTKDGEMVKVWNFGANWGTFFTAPDASGNIFDDASCTGAACGSNTTPRKTDLKVWDMAWNQVVAPLGSAAGCNKTVLTYCTADEVAGIFVKTWDIDPPGRAQESIG